MVVLRQGVSVTGDALRLAWDLECRGIQITLDKEDDLLVSPREQLTETDRMGIRQHKGELVSLVRLSDELVI